MPPRGPGIDQLSSLGWPFQFLGCYSCGRSWSRTWGRHRPCRAMHRTTANVCSVRRLKWAWHTACRQPTNGRYTAPRNEQTPRGAPTRRATVRVETDGETTPHPASLRNPLPGNRTACRILSRLRFSGLPSQVGTPAPVAPSPPAALPPPILPPPFLPRVGGLDLSPPRVLPGLHLCVPESGFGQTQTMARGSRPHGRRQHAGHGQGRRCEDGSAVAAPGRRRQARPWEQRALLKGAQWLLRLALDGHTSAACPARSRSALRCEAATSSSTSRLGVTGAEPTERCQVD